MPVTRGGGRHTRAFFSRECGGKALQPRGLYMEGPNRRIIYIQSCMYVKYGLLPIPYTQAEEPERWHAAPSKKPRRRARASSTRPSRSSTTKGVAHAVLEDIATAAEVTRGRDLLALQGQGRILRRHDAAGRAPARGDARARGAAAAPIRSTLRAAHDGRAGAHRAATSACSASSRSRTTSANTWATPRACATRHVASQDDCLAAIEAGFRACVAARRIYPARSNAQAAAVGAHVARLRPHRQLGARYRELLAQAPCRAARGHLFPRPRHDARDRGQWKEAAEEARYPMMRS